MLVYIWQYTACEGHHIAIASLSLTHTCFIHGFIFHIYKTEIKLNLHKFHHMRRFGQCAKIIQNLDRI